MAKIGMLLLLLAHFVTSALLVDVTKIRVDPKHGSVYGVFHASLSGGYAFDAFIARDVCEQLGVTIADRAQVQSALAHGFETCKFGWIDEKIAVIPRFQAKQTCGQGRVGIVVWRAALSQMFDVFCFNSTDFQAQARVTTTHENPTTTVMPTAHSSQPSTTGAHPKLAKTANSALSASRSALQSTSSRPSRSVRPSPKEDTQEAHAFSSTSPTSTVGLIAFLTTIFTFLLLAVVAAWHFKMNRFCVGLRDSTQQKECIETEIRGKDANESQAEVKLHDTVNTNDVSVTIKPENESGAAS